MTLSAWSVTFLALVVARVALRNRRLDMTWLLILWAPFNRLTFSLRNRAYREPRIVTLPNETKNDLFSHATAEQRQGLEAEELRLRTTYDLALLRDHSSRWNYRENLYVLRLLEVAFANVHLPATVTAAATPEAAFPARVLDVGSAIFCYATALERFARLHLASGPAQVTGLEVDGNVVYRDRTTRADHARAHALLASPETQFQVGDFVAWKETDYAFVTLFYPFVTRGALLRWGLPRGLFRKDQFLTHAADILGSGGFLLVVNHTYEERDIVRAFMQTRSDLRAVSSGSIESDLVDYAPDVAERSYSLYRREL